MSQSTDKNKLPQFKKFLSELSRKEYSEETVYNYKRDLQVFNNYLNKTEEKFRNIDKETILKYKSYLTSQERRTAEDEKNTKELSDYSINRMLSSLRSYLEFLEDKKQKIPISPDRIELIKTERKEEVSQLPSFKNIIRLIEAPSQFEKNDLIALRNQAMLEVLFSTGIRISELINLKKNHFSKRGGTIFIEQKNDKGRTTNLTPRAKKILSKYLEKRGKDKYPYLFIPFRGKNASKKNKHISPNYLQEKIKRYREHLNIKESISAKSFRTAFSAYLAEKGVKPSTIQEIHTHQNLNIANQYKPPSF